MTFIANIYAQKGSVITTRFRAGGTWWTGSTWSYDETAASVTTLAINVQESSTLENFYSATLTVPMHPTLPYVMVEYVRNGIVIGSDKVDIGTQPVSSIPSSSGVINPSLYSLISGALANLGKTNPSAQDMTAAKDQLNLLLAQWQVQNITWLKRTITFAGTGTDIYTIGPSGTVTEDRPARIYSVSVQIDNSFFSVFPISSTAYNQLYTRGTAGIPRGYTYNPKTVNGELRFDMSPTSGMTMVVECSRNIATMLNDTDTFDVPPEWLDAVQSALAYKLAPSYGVPLTERQLLGKEAKESYNAALSCDCVTTYFPPSMMVI